MVCLQLSLLGNSQSHGPTEAGFLYENINSGEGRNLGGCLYEGLYCYEEAS